MTDARLFALMLSAAFVGAMLAGIVFWGAAVYQRHELNGTAGTKASKGPFWAMIVPLLIVFFVMMAAFDKTPAWLDAILI